jgi:hypothetical protein
MKKCNYCLIEKDLIDFPKKGAICKSCESEKAKLYYEKNKSKIIERVKKYNEENIEKIKEYKNDYNKNNPNSNYHKKYREDNKDLISERRKIYYQKNKEKVKQKVKEYNVNNKEYVNQKKRENRENKKDEYNKKWCEYVKNRKESDPLYKLSCNIRNLISQSFKNQFTEKSKKTIEILGCDFEMFKKHLESQFTEDMNWDNYATYWQLDHKTPISWSESEEDVYKLNHYTNFQPLFWKDNISKGNRWED